MLLSFLHAVSAASQAECVGLGCSLVGSFHWASADGALHLRLNFSTEQADLATGHLTREGGSSVEDVVASLAYSRNGREALLKWLGPEPSSPSAAPSSSSWNALLLGSSPDHLWLHGGGGIMTELSRAAEVAEAASGASGENTTTTLTVSHLESRAGARGELLGLAEGELHRFRSLARDECLVASAEEQPHFGPCGSEDALWEVNRGKSSAVRAVKHFESGLCLQRRCYTSGDAPLRLGKCGHCGSARWVMEAGHLAAQSLTGDQLYCVAGNASAAGIDEEGGAEAGAAYTSPCGPLAEPVVVETARMTLAIPASSTDTLLDDWLADVAKSQKEEVELLRDALRTSQQSDAAARESLRLERASHGEKLEKMSAEEADLRGNLTQLRGRLKDLEAAYLDASKGLQASREERDAAVTSETAWRASLAEMQERKNTAEAESAAASKKMDEAVRRAAKAEAGIATMDMSLKNAVETSTEMTQKAATAQAKLNDEEAKNAAEYRHASEREQNIAAQVERAVTCEARIRDNWIEQKACAEAREANETCTARHGLAVERETTLKAELKAARAEAVGKAEAEGRASECAAAERRAADEATRLSAAKTELEKEANALRSSEMAASSAAGTSAEVAAQLKARHDECQKGAKGASKRIGLLEHARDELSALNTSCSIELLRYRTYTASDSAAAGPIARLGIAVRHLLGSDSSAVAAYVGAVHNALVTGLGATIDKKPSVTGRLAERASAVERHLSSMSVSAPIVDVPIDARPMVYACVLLLLLLLRWWLKLRTARRLIADAAQRTHLLEERVRTMQEIVSAAAVVSSVATMPAGGAKAGKATENGNGKAKEKEKALQALAQDALHDFEDVQ